MSDDGTMMPVQSCVAVIGTGSIGSRHLSVLKRMARIRPIAVPLRLSRLDELRAGGYEAAATLDEACELGATHCIVATDTARHFRDGLAAVTLGLDVLVEKPLSTNAVEADRLYREGTASGRHLFVACLMRFAKSMVRFRELLDEVGALHAVRVECQSYLPDWRPGRPYRESYSARPEEGGVLRDLIHEIDYAGWIFGWPDTLQARVENLGRLGIEADEAAELMWKGDAGIHVSVRMDYLSKPTRRKMTAFGSRGTLRWDGVQNTVSLHPEEGPQRDEELPQSKDDILVDQAQAFIEATRGGSASWLATGRDGVRALAVCDAARRASESRREEKVDYP